MKVIRLLAVFIAIVTYAPRLTWSGADYVPGKWLQTEFGPISYEQSDTCLARQNHSTCFHYKLKVTTFIRQNHGF